MQQVHQTTGRADINVNTQHTLSRMVATASPAYATYSSCSIQQGGHERIANGWAACLLARHSQLVGFDSSYVSLIRLDLARVGGCAQQRN